MITFNKILIAWMLFNVYRALPSAKVKPVLKQERNMVITSPLPSYYALPACSKGIREVFLSHDALNNYDLQNIIFSYSGSEGEWVFYKKLTASARNYFGAIQKLEFENNNTLKASLASCNPRYSREYYSRTSPWKIVEGTITWNIPWNFATRRGDVTYSVFHEYSCSPFAGVGLERSERLISCISDDHLLAAVTFRKKNHQAGKYDGTIWVSREEARKIEIDILVNALAVIKAILYSKNSSCCVIA